MSDNTEDMGLPPVIIDGVLHRLAVERQCLVGDAPGLAPMGELPIQRVRLDAHQAVADHEEAGHLVAALHAPTAEASACCLSESLDPIGDGFVAVHAAQHGSGRQGQHHRQRVTSPLATARIGNFSETVRQGIHLFGGKLHFGNS